MIYLIFILNFAISWFNAWGCGTTWDSTKAKGGFAHFMNWMGATMSACGFTWCYMVVLAFVGGSVTLVDETTGVAAPMLDPATVQAVLDLGYAVIILPILGSGLAITVASWRQFARSRSVGDGIITGWNTFAQVHNMYEATRALPGVFDRLGDFFGSGSSSSSSSDDNKGLVVILLVAIAVLGGILTTGSIIQSRRRAVRINDFTRQAA